MEFWIDLLWRVLVAGVVAFAVTFVWTFAAAKLQFLNKPHHLTETGGVIRPWPPIWIVMGLFLGLVVAGGIGAAIAEPTRGMIITMGVCTLIVAPLAFFALLYATPRSHVRWDGDGVEGPSSSYWPSRREMSWDVIAKTGVNWGGVYFIEDNRGDRIVWSWCHVGHLYFWNVLVAKRPDLLDQAKQALATNV